MRKLSNEELERKTIDQYKELKKTPLIIILDNVRSLNNIGSIFRTSDAFLVEAIYLCGITACPPNKDIHKTALGAEDAVSWKYFNTTLEAIADLKEKGFDIIAIEQVENSISLNKFEITETKKYALVFGHEVKGVDQLVVNQCDACIEIPQLGTKHSFNVSVTAGIVLWDLFQKLSRKH